MIGRWAAPAAMAALTVLAACSAGTDAASGGEGGNVSLRNLTETDVARQAGEQEFRVQGNLVPTPSDTRSRHFLLRERKTVSGTIVAILREEHDGKIAYARVEVDCAKRLFHVLGVGPSRAIVETARADDGPLRPITGLPLRQELSAYICERSGTPLAAAPQAG